MLVRHKAHGLRRAAVGATGLGPPPPQESARFAYDGRVNRNPASFQAGLNRQFLLLLVLLGLAGTVTVAVLVNVPTGGYCLAGLMAVTAILRAVMPAERLGALIVRPRWIDVAILLLLSLGLALLSASPNL